MIISEISYFTSTCQRINNEDFCSYLEQDAIVLCDGVGGQDNGEIASKLLVNIIEDELMSVKFNSINFFINVLNSYRDQSILFKNYHNMATTLTFSILQNNEIFVAWCGDSRIYHIRDGNIIFQTEDHTWVNDAIKSGIITFEESINHPKKNIITKAIVSDSDPSFIDFKIIDDIQNDDFILHCSDGVLESWSNQNLTELFHNYFNTDKNIDLIRAKCEQNSSDNSTAILYKINLT